MVCAAPPTPTLSAEPSGYVEFVMDGVTNRLRHQAKALHDLKDGLQLMALSEEQNPLQGFFLRLPGTTNGTYKGLQGMVLDYSRNLMSSASADHFSAGGPPDSLAVTLTRFGAPGEPVEGTFTATLRTGGKPPINVTQGRFKLTLEPSKTAVPTGSEGSQDAKPTPGTQP